MSKDQNSGPTGKGKRAKALLDELDSVKSLLGDAAQDVPSAVTQEGDEAVPTLTQDDDSQIPLLGGSPEATAKPGVADSVKRALSERANPFLSASAPPAQPKVTPAPPPAASAPAKAGPSLDEAQIRATVDEILAAWMPRIERELRERLIEQLKQRSNR